MDNKVAQTLARTFVQLGYITYRSNFRGVGETQGEHDNGIGERDDLLAVVAHMRAQPGQADVPLVLAGFSFGTFVLSHVAKQLRDVGRRRSNGWCSSARRRATGQWPRCRRTRS